MPDRRIGLFQPNGQFLPFENFSPKLVRQNSILANPNLNGQSKNALLRPKDWLAIWSIPGSSNAITIWWRLLHGKIPSRQRLKILGLPLQDDCCTVCPKVPESDAHFFVYCPSKKAIWSRTLPSAQSDEIWLNLRYPSALDSDMKAQYARTLSEIWSVHWGNIFANP
ncbi:hypothetical protein DM01DRAFT_1284157 [Hesseltinella vesiculosa]|uniref:Reverse transcriptase zinc-binding domain-containing protein n=1 Tax=Hesseltinella vesiculosa TaxID=101127 RepID=A0A1X2GNB6_9FUNG|nr:hypothetical protein DM01DRAFT_1284157 [Hesseltinella vesiculosa]